MKDKILAAPTDGNPFPNASTFAVATLGWMLLTMYGCFVPFEFQSLSCSDAVERFFKVLSQPIQPKLNTDWVINIAIFMPLGFLAGGMLGVDRSRFRQLIGCLLIIPIIGAFSTGIEFTQLWIPKRTSSVQDVAANTFGGTLGLLVWLLIGKPITDTLRGIDTLQGSSSIWRKLMPIYLVGLILLHTAPFDLCDWGELKLKYKGGGIRLIPFEFPAIAPASAEQVWRHNLLEKTFFNFGYFLPAGLILAGLGRPRGRTEFAALQALLAGFLLAGFVVALKFPVFSRSFEVTDILTGGLAVAFGWSLSGLAIAPNGTIRLRWLLLLLWSLGLVVMNWFPFNFMERADLARDNGAGFNWMPFLDYYEHDYLAAFDTMFRKMLVFVPIGILLSSGRRRVSWPVVAIVSLGFAAILEAGQNFLPGHYPTISDVLIEPVGALAGQFLLRLVVRNPSADWDHSWTS